MKLTVYNVDTSTSRTHGSNSFPYRIANHHSIFRKHCSRTRSFRRFRRVPEYGYRDYAPDLGRWASRDPIGEQGGLLLYVFTQNGTPNAVDALGLSGSSWRSVCLNITIRVSVWLLGADIKTGVMPPENTFPGDGGNRIELPVVPPGPRPPPTNGVQVASCPSTVNACGCVSDGGAALGRMTIMTAIGLALLRCADIAFGIGTGTLMIIVEPPTINTEPGPACCPTKNKG